MTYEQIEKEFDEQFVKLSGPAGEPKEWISLTNEGDVKRLKSFLKQSFIKYLQSEVDRLETLKQETLDHPMRSYDGIVLDSYNEGYEIVISDQITNLQAQIKELEV